PAAAELSTLSLHDALPIYLQTRGRRVISVEDDLLDADGLDDATPLAGEGALMSALLAHRTGRMGDIVATIQAEQDAVIRSEADRSEEHTSELQSRENLVCR